MQTVLLFLLLCIGLSMGFRPLSVSRRNLINTHNFNMQMNGMIELVDQDFNSLVLDSKIPVIVDFHANWCGPCKLMAPIFKELADEYPAIKFVKVDTDLHEDTVEQFNIQGLPLFVVIKEGSVVASHSGAISREPLKQFIEKHM